MFKKRNKYAIDPVSLSLTQPAKGKRNSFRIFLSGLGISVFIGALIAFLFFRFVDSPSETSLSREINDYEIQIQLLNNRADKVLSILQSLQNKDDRTYRTIFGMDPVDEELRNAGVGGNDQYEMFDVVENGKVLREASEKLDFISRQIVVQSQSFNELMVMVADKEKMLASIPSIMPVDKNKIRFSSGFGWRRNPFTHSGSQFHPGIDLAGPIGTPIYATGDGEVIDPFGSMTGYGIVIVIDHGYGFETLYAHLSKKLVKPGDKVKRGQIIGYLGNTGPSTGPHLHYEVHRNGNKVNPINYIYSGFTNEEFQEMIKTAEESHEILS
ncbi:MAG: peptidase M23 [Marinilabiliales bacterium]|nr:MAG: peptidase M23 [Marinilabiliales bacterium]